MRSIFLALTLSLPPAALVAQPLTLQALIDRQQSDPLFLAGQADLHALEAESKLSEDEAGWHAFAGASVGRYRELVTQDIRNDYYGRNVSLGIRHPLLGSLKRQLDLVQANQYERQRQQLRIALEQASQRLALRSAYADWWRVQQEVALCGKLIPVAERAGTTLRSRLQSQLMRGSEAELQMSEWEGVANRCNALRQVEADIREDLARVSMSDIPPTAEAVAEPLAIRPQPLVQWQALLNQHPRVTEKQNLRDQADRERDTPWYTSIDSDVVLADSQQYNNNSDKAGSGLVASLVFSVPFDLVGNTRARQQVADARYEAATERVVAEQRALGLELSRALRAYSGALATINQSRQQSQIAQRAFDEEESRRQAPGGNLENSLNTQRIYFQTAFDSIAAWHAAWLRQADLNLLTDDNPRFAALLGEEHQQWSPPNTTLAASPVADPAQPRRTLPSPGPGKWSQASYVWDSEALLDPARRSAQLQALRKAGMDKIYLGLKASQLNDLAVTRPRIEQLLQEAARQGLQVSLLLGDPGWIEPQQRQSLIDLLKTLKGLSFASLHLDLEVEQLGMPVPDQRLKNWLDTLRAASKESPWPVEISSHHRWFAEANPGQTCVPCALPDVGVRQVSLMIYTRNPQSSARMAEQIAKRWPALQFRLAQSTESQLPATESWAGSSTQQLQHQVSAWREQLQPYGIAGIDWQDWRDFPKW